MTEPLRDFALEVYFSRWEFAAEHNLTASDAESMSIRDLLALSSDADREALLDLSLGYTPTWGTDPLREAIAATYDMIERDQVLTFAGAGEALYWSMLRLLEPDDHVIVTVPNYQSIESLPLAAGVEVDGWPLWRGHGEDLVWEFDLDRFHDLIRPTTRAVAVNFPNNPTGFVPHVETWKSFLAACDERGIHVISDEVHRGVELDQSRTLPQAADLSPRAVSINVLSKAYGLPGLRVGWVTCRDLETLQRLERAKHYTSICNAGPSEFLATLALRRSDVLLERTRSILRRNVELITDFVAAHSNRFQLTAPDGGCVTFARYLGVDGVEEFCRRAVEEAGVMLLPSSVYRSELVTIPDDRFRVGLGRSQVPSAIDALDAHLRRSGDA